MLSTAGHSYDQSSAKKLHSNEPHSEKTGLWGFRLGPTQTGLYSYRRRLEA